MLDITTPKLPAPKGVTAGGQILAPFGYTEMAKTVNQKLDKASKALDLSAAQIAKGRSGDAELAQLKNATASQSDKAMTAAEIEQNKKVANAIVTAGRSVGMTGEELKPLAKLPYHYGDAEQKKVAQILKPSSPKEAGASSWRCP